ncbi:MAG: DNA polymerase III subunit chi [Rickettsiaceae bacterium]|nr:DNA polymerase III subunit chi [Rickettsiaceae bacterium]
MHKYEIKFYAVEEDLEKTACGVIEKCYQSGVRTLVICENESIQEIMNKMLWTFKQKSFIPHGSINEERAHEQQILITHQQENLNNANLLVLIGAASIDISNFTRIFVVYNELSDTHKSNIKNLKDAASLLDSKILSYKKRNDGTWEAS